MAVVSFAIVCLLAAGSAQAAGAGGTAQKLSGEAPVAGTCGNMKDAYRHFQCCRQPEKVTNLQLVPMNAHMSTTPNPCKDKKKMTQPYLDNMKCVVDGVIEAAEQAGGNVTRGFVGTLETSATPITQEYWKAGLCPVNVHWHLGAEHLSQGQYDEEGTGPVPDTHFTPGGDSENDRRLANAALLGRRCHHYDPNDEKFTKPYKWMHCADMYVGETYEIHWPHSTLGDCQTSFQYQTPFYDGVFCNAPDNLLELVGAGTVKTHENIGVQAQVFTIVNDEEYYYPDLMRHRIKDNIHWQDVAYYTGSTTGTARNNTMCSGYTPITWQVDRTCHLISASSFDKMCADMKAQNDDMSGDIHPHGSRVLVWQNLTADNQHDPRRM